MQQYAKHLNYISRYHEPKQRRAIETRPSTVPVSEGDMTPTEGNGVADIRDPTVRSGKDALCIIMRDVTVKESGVIDIPFPEGIPAGRLEVSYADVEPAENASVVIIGHLLYADLDT